MERRSSKRAMPPARTPHAPIPGPIDAAAHGGPEKPTPCTRLRSRCAGVGRALPGSLYLARGPKIS